MSVAHDNVASPELVRLEQARTLANAGQIPEAESIFRDLINGALASEALDGLGVIQIRANDYPAAISLFKQALARNPRNENALYHLARLAETHGADEIARDLYARMNAVRAGAATRTTQPAVTVSSPSLARPTSKAEEPESQMGVWDIILRDATPLAQKIVDSMKTVEMTVHPRISAYLSRLVTLTGLLAGMIYGLQLAASPLGQALHFGPLLSFRPTSFGQTLMATGIVVLVLGVVYVRSVRVTLARGRLQVEHGMFNRSFKNHEIWRVDDVRVHSGWMQQLTGDGTLTIEVVYSSGRRELVEVPGLASAARLRTIANELLDLSWSLRAHSAVKGIPAY